MAIFKRPDGVEVELDDDFNNIDTEPQKRGPKFKRTAAWCLNEIKEMLKLLDDPKLAGGLIYIAQLCHMRGYSHAFWLDLHKQMDKLYKIKKQELEEADQITLQQEIEIEVFQQFYDISNKIKERLEMKLVTNGLANKINVGMGIFVLKNKYGYADKIENQHTGKDGEPIQIQSKDKIANTFDKMVKDDPNMAEKFLNFLENMNPDQQN